MKQKVKKTVFIRTFGCQMNESDSELVRTILEAAEFRFTDEEAKAGVMLLNTCAVREHAVRRVRGAVHDIRYRANGRPVLIGILGCVPTHLKEDLFKDRHLKIDFLAGPDSYRRLPDLIRKAQEKQSKPFDLELTGHENYDGIVPKRQKGVNAWVTVTRGCDNVCTFCVVPAARGRERSRSPKNILNEVKTAVAEGFPQVTLLGQNVNSYASGGCDFAQLLEKISAVPGLKRIRFMSPHPKDFPADLLKVMAGRENICKHIHLPLQAGNDRVLKMMNRRYTRKDYLDLVAKISAALPQIALTTDVIVGFPTETDREFEDTVRVMKQVGFDAAFIFKYSERQGTLAAKKYKDDVPPAAKTERIVRLNELQKETSLKRNKALVGRTLNVLIEAKTTAKSARDVQGRTDGNKLVIIPSGKYRIGQFVPVAITDATAHVLKGRPAAIRS